MKRYGIGLAAASVLLAVGSMAALDGAWRGDLSLGFSSLPVVLNFSEQGGSTACTMDSPSQNAYGLPATVDYLSADSVAVSVGMIGARFSGRVGADRIVGSFSQSGHQFPLTLKRDESLLERRPQTPQPPFPYQTRDTVFASADGTLLAGTFALPEGYEKGVTPMCVFVTGSGPQNRDEELFEHRPFAVIADHLARNGVASFRYDDRGTASSQGDYASATLDTFRADARAALRFAKAVGEGPTGIIGHSEGGTIALLLAEEGEPDFVVSLAGMAVSGKETVLAQNRSALQQTGYDTATIDATLALISKIFDEVIRQYAAGISVPIDVDAIAAETGAEVPAPLMKSLKDNMAGTQSSPYFASILSVDPRPDMPRISCPVLALNGTLDTQVSSAENLGAIAAGIRNAKVVELPGLNHLFQQAVSGQVAEYAQIRETISPEVLAILLDFLRQHP